MNKLSFIFVIFLISRLFCGTTYAQTWSWGRFGSSHHNDGYQVAIDAAGNIHITGRIKGYVDFDMTGAYANLSSIGQDGAYIAKYNDVPIGVKELRVENVELKIYPNPNNGRFYLSGLKSKYDLEIMDITGKMILKTNCDGENNLIDLSVYQKGLYFLKVYNRDSFLNAVKVFVE